ncbi:MAG: cell division protein FtsQ/DivIB [Paracoccaceae bacterium]|nr:cell division protein FtsQ/DivIB [Loktanella sp.]
MRPLAERRPRGSLKDPAPSKWRYRWQRWMLTPGIKAGLRIGTPLAVIGIVAAVWFSDADNRTALTARIDALKSEFQHRPEFLVTSLRIKGSDDRITADIERIVKIDFPISSFDLELEEMRRRVAALHSVQEARIKVADSGALEITVIPRVPVALWRTGDNLRLLDQNGIFTGALASRAERLDLPVIAGEGAGAHIEEALAIFARARPISDRVRGLARVGERRWDLVLDRGVRIMLPVENTMAAIDRVIALDAAQDVLERDVAVVDLRNANRPTIRMTNAAAVSYRRAGQTGAEE